VFVQRKSIFKTLGAAPTSLTGNTGAGSAPLSLGTVINGVYVASGNYSNGTAKLTSVLTITQPGVYIFSYNVLATANAATFSNVSVWVDDAYNVSNVNYLGYHQIPYTSVAGTTNTIAVSSSQIYTVTATTTFGLYSAASVTGGSISTNSVGFSFRFVRIA
jgi:hypothetical protein